MSHPSEIRSNVDRQVQKIWGGNIAVYLFLGGLGAGAYFVSGIATLLGIDQPAWNETAMAGVSVSWVVVGIGLIFLASHLGKPMRSPWAVSKVRSSWISRGVIFFSVFGLLALVHTFVPLSGGALVAVVVSGMLFALLTMAYTGALLSSSKGYPLWRTSILPVLFLVSGAVTGLALVILAAVVAGKTRELGLHQVKSMCLAGAVSIIVELLAIMSFMNSAYKQADSKEAASRMVRRAGFLWGDLVVGLTVPLVMLLGVYFGAEDKDKAISIASFASILILIGGYLLRHSILSAGMASSLQTAGFKFRPVANPDFVVSEFGKLPPS